MASLSADIELTPRLAPHMHPLALHHNTAEHPPGFPHSTAVLLLSPQMRSTIYSWHSASARPVFDNSGTIWTRDFLDSVSHGVFFESQAGTTSRGFPGEESPTCTATLSHRWRLVVETTDNQEGVSSILHSSPGLHHGGRLLNVLETAVHGSKVFRSQGEGSARTSTTT
jgi:hypothetical protein